MGILKDNKSLLDKVREWVKEMTNSGKQNKPIKINLGEVFDLPKEHRQFIEDEETYLKDHFEEFYRQYPEQYVAIRNHVVIDASDDETTLINRVYKLGEERIPTYVTKLTKDKISPIPMRTPVYK